MHIPKKHILEFRKKILSFYKQNRRELPWRQTTDPYAILVSEIMLQQTQVDRVIPKYVAWLERFPTVRALAHASLADVLKQWSGLGYNRRGKYLHDVAKQIVEDCNGIIPDTVESLQKLPGIGPYTARSILIFANNKDIATVDTNIRRILIHEFKLSEKTSQKELFLLAQNVMPKGHSRDWHNALMDYGATLMTSRRTGIKPLTTQPKYLGSKRYYRGKIIKLLTEKDAISHDELAATYQGNAEIYGIVADLEREGLIEKVRKKKAVSYTLKK